MKKFGEGIWQLLGRGRDCLVVEIVVNGGWHPGHDGSTQLMDIWNMVPSIEKLPMECKDCAVWTTNLKGSFSTKSTWNLIRQRAAIATWARVVWCADYIPKHILVA